LEHLVRLEADDMHDVAVLALNGVLPFDLGIACEVFAHVRLADGTLPYRVRVCGETRDIDAGAFILTPPWGIDGLADADTIIVAGIADPERLVPQPVVEALRSAWLGGARLASICTGAFVLAATGLLDGQRATTHWRAAADLARQFPAITIEPDVLFVDEGRIVTSAGASAGLDMCLHLVGRDFGQAVAADAARLAVAPLHRDGGQAQFVRQAPSVSDTSLASLTEWMLANLNGPLDVGTLAARACVSPRTFARRFREQTGATPIQWLLIARIRRAQELLETTKAPIELIARQVGFDAPVTFRTRFKRIVGVSPIAYRNRFAAPVQVRPLVWKDPHRRRTT
jgi:transcriptional regulator GlxA family with amidase domain